MSQATDAASAPSTPEPSLMPCPFGDPVCAGISGLLMGECPCWPCFVTAQQSAVDFAGAE